MSQRRGCETTNVAVIGATGTAGSRVTARLKGRGVAVIELARAHGVDLISGCGLAEALEGVDVVIDVSDPVPDGDDGDIIDALATASHNLIGACALQGVQRLVALTLAGIDDPTLDASPYYVAKRAAKEIVLDGPVPATIVKSTQYHEFATHPAAVSCEDDEVLVEDWLIQPIAADTVADVLVEAALGQTRAPRTITGPQDIRLPELTSKLLASQGDDRPVRTVQPALTALAGGALLAPNHAMVLGPDIETWLDTMATDGAAKGSVNA
ncbi:MULTISPECIES: SDR family oxidoreductase [unclassified Mycobacterium]|uniref:SDR family oxidoreductase n=1 Tax=unclassified Mycobacterium TaxID=2642494 RepID=UPI00096F72EC|nr:MULTISPECIES: NAD(P)H-binding protein [unclassified Mycobacterium]OMC17541.1 NmrA family protein [Mycobacterium sp. SP-6446]OMC55684.1 NmrA family protein [Mycobacterium sp. IS-836]